MSKSPRQFRHHQRAAGDREVRRPQMAGRSAAPRHADDPLPRADRLFGRRGWRKPRKSCATGSAPRMPPIHAVARHRTRRCIERTDRRPQLPPRLRSRWMSIARKANRGDETGRRLPRCHARILRLFARHPAAGRRPPVWTPPRSTPPSPSASPPSRPRISPRPTPSAPTSRTGHPADGLQGRRRRARHQMGDQAVSEQHPDRRLPVRCRALSVSERSGAPSICHCRMCQKAFGGFFGPLVTAHDATWTRGAPKWFQSSNRVRRAFCGDCGTPLSLRDRGRASNSPSAPSTIRPPAAPVIQVNLADKLPFFDGLAALRCAPRIDEVARLHGASIVSHQHPDHDTETWPPAENLPMTSSAPSTPRSNPTPRGCLDVGDGHQIYWERVGTPGAKPAVYLHGGPGGGMSAQPAPRLRSRPLRCAAVRPARLRQVDARLLRSSTTPPGTSSPISKSSARWRASSKWLVFGGSWGSTLALAYAETHPDRVSELVLRGIFTLRRGRIALVLPARRLAAVPRQVGALRRADSRGRARRHDGRLPQAPRRCRPRRQAAARHVAWAPLGRRDHHAVARTRPSQRLLR